MRAVNRIVDANSLEDLLSGSREESVRTCTILLDLASGSPRHSRAAEGVARRRGLSTQYIEDRAKVLLDSAEERGRQDAYKILGLPPLASVEAIRERWRKLARELHPDSRGDENGLAKFFLTKRAYDTLSDPDKRCAYEDQWRHTIGVMEEARVALEEGRPEPLWRRWWGGGRIAGREQEEREVGHPPDGVPDPRWREAVDRLGSFASKWTDIEGRLAPAAPRGPSGPGGEGASGLTALASMLEAALGTLSMGEIEGIEERITGLLPMFDQVRDALETLRELKKAVPGYLRQAE